MNHRVHPISAIILTGGASSRMGSDKWALPWPQPSEIDLPSSLSWTMLDEMLFNLNEVCGNTVVVCSQKQEQEIRKHLKNYMIQSHEIFIACDMEEYQGPLYGILQGLMKLEEMQIDVEWTFVTSCDVPLLDVKVIKVLQAEISDSVSAIIPKDEEYSYPLCGLYKKSVSAHAEGMLHEGQRKLMLLFERVPTVYLSVDELRKVDAELRSLVNLNERELYEFWYAASGGGGAL